MPNSKQSAPKALRYFHHLLAFGALSYLILMTPWLTPTKPIEATAPKVVTITLPKPDPIPVKINTLSDPLISAKAAIIIDPDSGIVLFSKNPDMKLHPASTTKIMTAVVALDTYQLADKITVTSEDRTLGQTMKLVKGEQLTVKDLLYGALVPSGNDAALALAQAFPNTGYSGFVTAMNTKAQSLGLKNTHYENVSGLESPSHKTTARDLAKLTTIALTYPEIAKIVATPEITIKSLDGSITHKLHTTNQLLGKIDGIVGVKTGWTEFAGECLITAVDRNNQRIIAVVLGSEDRFQDSTNLINWAYNSFSWKQIGQAETFNLTEH